MTGNRSSSKGTGMNKAELIIDLHDLGNEVGRALGREETTFPALGALAALWRELGVDITAMHVVVASASTEATESFEDLHFAAWWKTEQAFLDTYDFTLNLLTAPLAEHGPVALSELITTTALSRSDSLLESADPTLVIVMSNAAEIAPAVTHARGVPVMIAGTSIHDSGLAHARLETSWLGLLKDRFAEIALPDVELRNGRPWSGDVAISTPYDGMEGRDLTAASLPSFAESVAIFDPSHFEISDGTVVASPRDAGLAAVVHTLGLGALLHVEDVSGYEHGSTQIAAVIYRLATDHPEIPLVIASARPSLVAMTADLGTFSIPNSKRVLRLCLPERETVFDEAAFATSTSACRIVIERSLTAPLLEEAAEPDDGEPSPERHLQLVPESAIPESSDATNDSETVQHRSPSPTLTLYANPNTMHEVSGKWREQNSRRFLMLGANGAEATPADARNGVFLPISLGGCTDFLMRRPELRPGCIVEGILNDDGSRWLIVSDPIERRRRRRNDPTLDAEFAAQRAADAAAADDISGRVSTEVGAA